MAVVGGGSTYIVLWVNFFFLRSVKKSAHRNRCVVFSLSWTLSPFAHNVTCRRTSNVEHTNGVNFLEFSVCVRGETNSFILERFYVPQLCAKGLGSRHVSRFSTLEEKHRRAKKQKLSIGVCSMTATW